RSGHEERAVGGPRQAFDDAGLGPWPDQYLHGGSIGKRPTEQLAVEVGGNDRLAVRGECDVMRLFGCEFPHLDSVGDPPSACQVVPGRPGDGAVRREGDVLDPILSMTLEGALDGHRAWPLGHLWNLASLRQAEQVDGTVGIGGREVTALGAEGDLA